MHNAIYYSWIGKKWIYTNYTNPHTVNLTMCKKYYLQIVDSTIYETFCLIQLMNWIHPIFKPEKEKHNCHKNRHMKLNSQYFEVTVKEI